MKFLSIDLCHQAIVLTIACIGCLWHLSDVSKIYFSYETNVNVNFEPEIMVHLPGVTICVNSSKTVIEAYFLKRNPELAKMPEYQNSKYFYLAKELRSLFLSQQLNEATIGYKQLFNSCLIMKPVAFENKFNQDYIDCDQVSPIRQYITYSRKCFFIASQLNDENSKHFLVDHDTTLRDNGFPLFQIKMNNQFVDSPMVFIHSRTTPFLGFMGGQTNGIHLNNTRFSSYTLSYVKTTSELLPPPYKTMCRDYRKIGFRTLSHCIVSCKANFFIKEFNGWHPDIPADENYNLNVKYCPLELKENKTLDKTIADKCQLICSKMQDCSSQYYSTTVIGNFERSIHYPQYDHTHGIYIYLPTGINTHYKHLPRLHLIEYICYFASVFSLWFGFSIIACWKIMVKCSRFHQYKNQVLTNVTDDSSKTSSNIIMNKF